MATQAKPFLKWAGGKSQLIEQFTKHYPKELKSGLIKNYYEPFLGGGAVFFDIINHYPVENFYLSDVNKELILVYQVVQKKVEQLLELLQNHQKAYHHLDDEDKKAYFYKIRDEYNQNRSQIKYKRLSKKAICRAAQMIFLNKTCFNGLFRLNKTGAFNVPFGDSKNPKIMDDSNLNKVSKRLQQVDLKIADFTQLEDTVTAQESFIYFDPPYRPLTQTAGFTAYSQNSFDEKAQIQLAQTFKSLDAKGVKLMLSNSNPKNVTKQDTFFETQYAGFHIQTVLANRMINSVSSKRGQITELLITNY